MRITQLAIRFTEAGIRFTETGIRFRGVWVGGWIELGEREGQRSAGGVGERADR
jgi:hypothetical protein